jgi:hypothetical protein
MLTAAPERTRMVRFAAAHWLVPVALSALIATWQFSFNSASPEPRRSYAMTASMGLCEDATRFFYFFYHFGLFPVGALEVPRLGPSRQAAAEFVAKHGDRLKMDFGWPTNTPRFGDYAKLFLFYPDAWTRGDPAHPSAIPCNEYLFIAALLATFWAFWLAGHGLLGTLVVVLVGSDPFQILETYGRGNIFSIPISFALLMLAVHLRFLTRRDGIGASAWGIAIGSAMLLATVREIRAEAGIIAVSALASILLARAPLARRLLLAGAFVLVAALTAFAWSKFWAGRFAAAERFVARAGGEVFHAPHNTHHAFWHAVCCGLGDYGEDRGFSWDDELLFEWATTLDPVTNPHPLPYDYQDGYYFEETYDGIHHIAPTDLPEYNQLVRRRVLTAIREHPVWYAGILWQRLLAIQRDATPAALSLGNRTLALPGVGWITAPVLLFTLWRRKYFHAMLILFVLPLSAVALLVYSAKGMTSYGIAHLIALAVAIDLLVRARWPATAAGGPDAH